MIKYSLNTLAVIYLYCLLRQTTEEQTMKKHLFAKNKAHDLNTSQHYNQTLTNQVRNTNGVYSPYNVFLENLKDLYYIAKIKVSGIGGSMSYNVAIDHNLPFSFITEKCIKILLYIFLQDDPSKDYIKLRPNNDEIEIIITYLKSKFPQITQYNNSSISKQQNYFHQVFFVVETPVDVNSQLSVDFSFYYLIGEGAILFQSEHKFHGYLGLGLQKFQQFPDLNLIVALFENNVLENLFYSLYFGNDPGYIDSVLYLGGYEKIFISSNGFRNSLIELKVTSDHDHTWCLNIKNMSFFQIGEEDDTLHAQKNYKGCLSSIQPIIQLPQEIIFIIQSQLESDGSLKCDFKPVNFSGRNQDLLECSSKLLVFELSKYPTLQFDLLTLDKNETFTAQLTAQEYIWQCWNDVDDYLKKCITFLAREKTPKPGKHPIIILGLPFLRTYYTYYDLNNQSLSKKQLIKYLLRNCEIIIFRGNCKLLHFLVLHVASTIIFLVYCYDHLWSLLQGINELNDGFCKQHHPLSNGELRKQITNNEVNIRLKLKLAQ